MRKPDQFLSIFFLDPRIFKQVQDNQIDRYRNGWEEIIRRILAEKSPISPTSAVGALVVNLKSKNGNTWYDEVEIAASCDQDVEYFLSVLSTSNRLIKLNVEFEVEDLFAITDEEKKRLIKDHGVAGFIDISSFEDQTFKKQPWWAQYAGGYRTVDIDARIKQIENFLLYADDIIVYDRYWEPDNNHENNDPSSKSYKDFGYKFAYKFFKFIAQRNTLSPPRIEVHTSEYSFYLKTTTWNPKKQRHIPKKNFGRHKLSTFKEVLRVGRKISSYDDFYKRTKVCLSGITATLFNWPEKKFKIRVFSTEFGTLTSNYGVNQSLPEKKDSLTPMSSTDFNELVADFKAEDCKKSRLIL